MNLRQQIEDELRRDLAASADRDSDDPVTAEAEALLADLERGVLSERVLDAVRSLQERHAR